MTSLIVILEEDDPVIVDIMNWTNQSPLKAGNWYGLAVELIGHYKASAIQANHSGGGNRECLCMLLSKWWNRSTEADRSWQVIVDTLEKVGECVKVIEAITDNCSICQ